MSAKPAAVEQLRAATIEHVSEHIEADLIVDTNAVLDFVSLLELEKAAEKAISANAWGNDPAYEYRRERLRYALLFLWGSRQQGVNVGTCLHELEAKTVALADPESSEFRTEYCRLIAHYFFDHVLAPWSIGALHGFDTTLKGTPVDDALLAEAEASKVPFVTNEGWGAEGMKSKGLRKKAERRGVTLMSTKEWVRVHVSNEKMLALDFMRACCAGAPPYLEQRKHQGDGAPQALKLMLDIYEHALGLS